MFAYEKKHLEMLNDLSECMVLLKKDGKFPIDKPCKIACYGNGARNTLKGGTGSGEVNSRFFYSIEEELEKRGFIITTKEWLDKYDSIYKETRKAFVKSVKKEAKKAHMQAIAYAMGRIMPEMEYDIPLDYSSDMAIYVLARICGEGSDRHNIKGDFRLTDSEIRDIKLLNEKYDKFMLILNVGGPIDLSPVVDVKNILILSQLGVNTSSALVNVLLGVENPSGKLTTTWSTYDDYNEDVDLSNPDDTRYVEGIYVGYRYFDSVGKKAMYPFGYGLSYTEFSHEVKEVKVDKTTVSIDVLVKNIGNYAGKEIIEAYISKPSKMLDNPYQDLVSFKKTNMLDKGAEEVITLTFDITDFPCYKEMTSEYVLEHGSYILRVGSNSVITNVVAVLDLDSDLILRKCKHIIDKPDFEDKIYKPKFDDNLDKVKHYKFDTTDVKMKYEMYNKERKILDEVKELSNEELAKLCMGTYLDKAKLLAAVGNASRSVAGAAGESRMYNNKSIVMADGPAGLRLVRRFYRDKKGVHSIGENGLPETMLEYLTGIKRFIFKMLVKQKKKAPKGCVEEYQYATAIPIATAIAQSFNLDFAYKCGDIVGSEMELFKINLWLAPALNIHRSVLCGRNFEYYSEDPLISGLMTTHITLGVQKHKKAGVTIKHFACNNQEYNRMCNNSILSERALREIYLKGFEICIKKASPASIMTSYNLVNGTHTAEHYGLQIEYLRNECDYNGLIMTDWSSSSFLNSKEKYRANNICYVIKGGGDIFMPGKLYDHDVLLKGLDDNIVTREEMEISASNVIRMSEELNK